MTAGEPIDGLSIIIPTHERPGRLARCLTALAEMSMPDLPVEVVVVDDGSTEAPRSVVDAVADRLDIRLHSQPNTGPAGARNTGAGLARFRWLAFTDDDCTPGRDWAESLVHALTVQPEGLIGGSTVNAIADNVYSGASQHLVDALYRWQLRHPELAFWTSNNMACSCDAFLELGGFDESFPLPAGEDREFGARWARSGRPLHHIADARVEHHHDLDLAGFWRQHHNYGRGAARYREVLADDGDTVDVQPPTFYLTLLAEPFRHARPLQAASMSMLIGLSQVATVAGFVTERRR